MSHNLAASTWGVEEVEAAKRVIDSGIYTMGVNVDAFEREFAAYFDMEHAVMVNSGSSANLVAVAALFYKQDRPLRRGDEVIVPALSWATTFHPLQQYGLKLRFVDIDLHSLNLDVRQLEGAMTGRTRAIVAVSVLGNPAQLHIIREFADRNGLYLLEDNCESMDADVGGKKTGTFGHMNTFSFFFSHHISTMEGGMITTNDEELAHLCRSLRAHGWTRDLPSNSPIHKRSGTDQYEAYNFILPGYNVRPLEIEAAVGREQLKKLPAFTAQRRKNLAVFQRLFAGDDRFIIQQENGRSSAFCFTIILKPGHNRSRQKIFEALNAADIGYRIITGGNFLRHEVVRFYEYSVVGDAAPNADIAHDQGFFVGNHPFDLTEELEHLHHVLSRACGRLEDEAAVHVGTV